MIAMVVMTRFRFVAASFAALMVSGVVACQTHRPDPLQNAAPVSPTQDSPIGLDTRPSNAACVAGPAPTHQQTVNALIGFTPITKAELFTSPVESVTHDGKLYVLEQGGKLHLVSADGQSTSVVLDVSKTIVSGGEAGLLGLAFHPQFATNGFVYIYHTKPYPTTPLPDGIVFQSVLSRYHSSDNGLTIDIASEKRILVIDQPFSNHNGGTIAFGNDGFLYWGLGDGGSGGDPFNNAQTKTVLLGKMLRIDVDGGDPYAIPPTNPFATGVGGKPEIYAYGLRNPYRWRFDKVTGDLWVGDVGQGAREEIDKIVLGGNYGWHIREGKTCYSDPMCDPAGLIDPVVDHPRTEATVITGGVVYRGAAIPLIQGKYVYGDFGTGSFYTIPIDNPAPLPVRLDEGLERRNPSSISLDKDGEIIFTDYFNGTLYRIIPGIPGTAVVPDDPAKLSDTGCVDKTDPKKPAAGLFFYDVNVDQWLGVDGLSSQRWLSIPQTDVITTRSDGLLEVPPGSVAVKTISLGEHRIETQILLKRPTSQWNALSYVWAEDQTEATLSPGPVTITLPSGKTYITSTEQQCMSCHLADGNTQTLGVEASQLDRNNVDYGGGRLGNPLATLEKLGMLDTQLIPRDRFVRLANPSTYQTPASTSRSYMHANCSRCHSGGRDGDVEMDLRVSTPLAMTNVCNVPGTNGVARLKPGNANDSLLVRVMQSTTDGERMPPTGVILPDAANIATISSWIGSLGGCN